MTSEPNAVPESSPDSQTIAPEPAPAAMSATRPLYWSVRRELWENRSIYLAPLAAAVVLLFGFLLSTIALSRRMRGIETLEPARQAAALAMPYSIVAVLLILNAFVVGVFYCLDALHSERRDRSILFWKSLPVSDLTTVLSKASIPLVVLPLLIFAIILATQLAMLLLNLAALRMHGLSAAMLLTKLRLFQMSLVLLYGLAVLALWHAPVYAWLLLVSGWARRTPFLWAVMPLLAIAAVEKIAFNTSYFASMLSYRLTGSFAEAFAPRAQDGEVIDRLAQLDPGKFLTSPGLWIGLAFAAAFLVAAARLRRYREPI
jgi:ABC-2 type transport system permease protein